MSIVIPTRINQTAAQWALDSTVYSANKILVTTDVFYGGTNQPKYKYANGSSTWAALNYFPVSGYDDATSSTQTQLDSKLSAMDYFNVNNLSVVDSTAYFIGQSTTAGTTVNQIPLVPIKAGTITTIVSEVFSASTIASNEGGTLEFFYNDGANSTVISNDFKLDANRHAFVAFSGLNISVNAGNTYFVYTAPVLSTNPTGIQFRFNVYMK